MNTIKAYAKINLFLKVYPKAPQEKKHKIHSVFCIYKKLYDVVHIATAKEHNIKCLGVFGGKKEGIYIDKAIKTFEKIVHQKIILNVKIYKNIPSCAGLGGSSSAIASIIGWVCKRYKIKLTQSYLLNIAMYIGSDVPFFLSHYKAAIVTEYGNKVIPTKVHCNFGVVLTGIQVCSKNIYALLDQHPEYRSKVNIQKAQNAIRKGQIDNEEYNDLWPFVAQSKPQLNVIYNELKQKHNVVLSGSGGSFVKIWPKTKK